jgi:hypothetical protein
MALIETADDLSIIKVALDESLCVGINYTSDNDEVEVEYHFIKVVVSEGDLKTKKNTSTDGRENVQPLTGDRIKCICFSSNKEDPLKIYGTAKTMDDFLEFARRHKQVSYDLIYNKKDVKIYPRDWYDCFEINKDERIKEIKKRIPDIIEKAKNVVIEPPPKYDAHTWTHQTQNILGENYKIQGLSADIPPGSSARIRAEDKRIMDALLSLNFLPGKQNTNIMKMLGTGGPKI